MIIKKIKKLNYKYWSFIGLGLASATSVILSFAITASKNTVERSNIKSKVDFISESDLKLQKQKYNINKNEFDNLAQNLFVKKFFLNSISAHQILYYTDETTLDLLNELTDLSAFQNRWPNFYFYLKIDDQLVISKTGYEIKGLSLVASNINGEIILETPIKIKGFSVDKTLENAVVTKIPSEKKSLIYVTGKSKLPSLNPKIAAITLQYLFDSYNKANNKKQPQNNIMQTQDSGDTNLNVVNKNNENQSMAFKKAIADIGTIMLFDEKGNFFNLDSNKLMIPKLDDGGRLIFKTLKDNKLALTSQIIDKKTNQLLFELDLPLIFSESLVANNLRVVKANLKDYKINSQLVKIAQSLGFTNLSEIINANAIPILLKEKPLFENKNINEIKSFNFWFKNTRVNDSQKTQNPLKISYFFANPIGIAENNILLNAVFDFSIEGKNIKIPEGISFDAGSNQTITTQAITNFDFSNYKGTSTTSLDEQNTELMNKIQQIKKEILPINLDKNSRVFANQVDSAFKSIKSQRFWKNIDNSTLSLIFLLNQASQKSKINDQLVGDYLKSIFDKVANLVNGKIQVKIQNKFTNNKYYIDLEIINAGQLVDTIELQINNVLPTNQAFDAAITLAPSVFIDQSAVNISNDRVVSFDNLASLKPIYFSNALDNPITQTKDGVSLESTLTTSLTNINEQKNDQIIQNGAIYLAFKPTELPTDANQKLYLFGSDKNLKENSISVFIQKTPVSKSIANKKINLENSYYIGLEYLDKKETSSTTKKIIKALYTLPNIVLDKKMNEIGLPKTNIQYNYKGTETLTDFLKDPSATLLLEIVLNKKDWQFNLWTSNSKNSLNNYISSTINWDLTQEPNKEVKTKEDKNQSKDSFNYGIDVGTLAYQNNLQNKAKSFIDLKGLAIFNNNSMEKNNFESLSNRLKVIQGFINQYFD